MLLLVALLLASLALGAVAAGSNAATATLGIAPAKSRALRVFCPKPATLRLTRFEDGSARLDCANRVLVRVSVPG